MPDSTARPADAAPATPQDIAARWALITASKVMRTDVITVSYSTPLSEVERILSDNRISGAPVTDESGHIVGIVSIKDIIEHYTQDPDSRPRRGHGFYHLSSEEMLEDDFDSFDVPGESEDTAQDVMSATVYKVGVDAGLNAIAGVMSKHRIHRVLVEDQGKYVGLISTMEILDALNA